MWTSTLVGMASFLIIPCGIKFSFLGQVGKKQVYYLLFSNCRNFTNDKDQEAQIRGSAEVRFKILQSNGQAAESGWKNNCKCVLQQGVVFPQVLIRSHVQTTLDTQTDQGWIVGLGILLAIYTRVQRICNIRRGCADFKTIYTHENGYQLALIINERKSCLKVSVSQGGNDVTNRCSTFLSQHNTLVLYPFQGHVTRGTWPSTSCQWLNQS